MSPDESLRKACLELACQHERLPESIVKAAAKFEAFVKNGTAPQPLAKSLADIPMDQVRRTMGLDPRP